MKTNEFIKKLDECGGKSLKVDNIFSDDELYLTSIKTSRFNITFYHDEEPNEIFDIISEYLNTPVEEREEEKKYYLKHKGFCDGNNILNLEISTQNYYTSDVIEYTDFKTKFTQSEIDEMPECYTHPTVWEQVPVKKCEEIDNPSNDYDWENVEIDGWE